MSKKNQDFVPWNTYWDKKQSLKCEDRGTFNIYSTEDEC